MEWRLIRQHYLNEWKRTGKKQTEIAKTGKLDQSRISTLKTNAAYIPTIDVFVRAVEGLGVKPSDFFLQIERQTNSDVQERRESTITNLDHIASGEVGDGGGSSLSTPDKLQRVQELFEDLSVTFGSLAGRVNAPSRKTSKARRRKSSRPRRTGTDRR